MAPFPENMTSEHGSSLTAPVPDFATTGLPEKPAVTEAELREDADALVRGWQPLPSAITYDALAKRLVELRARLGERLKACRKLVTTNELTPQLELLESSRMFQSAIPTDESIASTFRRLPHVRVASGDDLPQVVHLAMGYLSAAKGIWSEESLAIYVEQVQRHHPLLLREIRLLPESLKLAQLQFILDRADEAFAAGEPPPIEQSPFSAPIHSLRRLSQAEWSEVLEALIPFGVILRQDPGGVFESMELETRSAYHQRVAELATYADASEVETAQTALELARQAANVEESDPRLALRKRHLGYYLFAEGRAELQHRIGYHPPVADRLRSFIRSHNEELYILGIFMLGVLLITALILPLVPHHEFWLVMGALLFALLPATQGAVDLVNATVSALFKAEALAKVDLSKGVPRESTTFVVVPTLLLHERQVRELLEELEARYLSNKDPNIHFGLLTDLPDTKTRPPAADTDPLVRQAVQSINELNEKYAGHQGGSFFLLHRERTFNSRQGVWMGWSESGENCSISTGFCVTISIAFLSRLAHKIC